VDPEDGITKEIALIFAGRSHERRVYDWSSLWKTLFPGDTAPLPTSGKPNYHDLGSDLRESQSHY
jgi:hypothetical protein